MPQGSSPATAHSSTPARTRESVPDRGQSPRRRRRPSRATPRRGRLRSDRGARMHGPGSGERRLDHRDSRCVESSSGRVGHSGGNHCETFRGQDLCENRRALDRCGSDLDHRVARTKPSGRHRPFSRDPEHLSNHERLAHCTGHLGVPADEHRSHPIERVPHRREQRLHILSGRAFGQQHAREKPSRTRTGHRDVVRIDGDGVRPDPRPGQGYGVPSPRPGFPLRPRSHTRLRRYGVRAGPRGGAMS